MSGIDHIKELVTEIEDELRDAKEPALDQWIALAGIQASLAQTEALICQQEVTREAMALQRDALAQVAAATEPPPPAPDPEAEELACAWSDYRKDYGVNPGDIKAAYKAFTAGWKVAREGDQSGALR